MKCALILMGLGLLIAIFVAWRIWKDEHFWNGD